MRLEIIGALDARLAMLQESATTDGCRESLTAAFRDFAVSELEEHGPWMKNESKQPAHHFTSSCDMKRRRKDNEAPQIPSSDLRIFYFITLHQHPQLTQRIIYALQHPNHFFALHLDANAPDSTMKELQRAVAPFSNVYIIPKQVEVVWGGFSMVQVLLNAIEVALRLNERTAVKGAGEKDPVEKFLHEQQLNQPKLIEQLKEGVLFDYFINLSGSSYPLKSDLYIREFLAGKPKDALLMGMRTNRLHHNEFFHFVQCDNRIHRVGKLPQPVGMQVYTGTPPLFATSSPLTALHALPHHSLSLHLPLPPTSQDLSG
jgi:hypothetical protein